MTRSWTVRFYLLVLILSIGCHDRSVNPGHEQHVNPESQQAQENTRMGKQRDAVMRNVKDASLVVIARVLTVGDSPKIWSGAFAAHQAVHYEPLRWLKGVPPDPSMTSPLVVFHPLVAQARTVDANEARLNGSLFVVGAHLILFVGVRNGRFETFDENYGVLPSDQKTIDEVEDAVRAISVK